MEFRDAAGDKPQRHAWARDPHLAQRELGRPLATVASPQYTVTEITLQTATSTTRGADKVASIGYRSDDGRTLVLDTRYIAQLPESPGDTISSVDDAIMNAALLDMNPAGLNGDTLNSLRNAIELSASSTARLPLRCGDSTSVRDWSVKTSSNIQGYATRIDDAIITCTVRAGDDVPSIVIDPE